MNGKKFLTWLNFKEKLTGIVSIEQDEKKFSPR